MQVALHLVAQVSVKLEHCADLVVLASVGPAVCISIIFQCSTASNWNFCHACPRRGHVPRRGHAAYFMAWLSTQLLYILMTLRKGIGRHLTLIACIIAIQTSALLGYLLRGPKKELLLPAQSRSPADRHSQLVGTSQASGQSVRSADSLQPTASCLLCFTHLFPSGSTSCAAYGTAAGFG